MSRKMRKEVTILNFEGVAVDGGFVFSAEYAILNNFFAKVLATKEDEMIPLKIRKPKLSKKIYFKMVSYEEGVFEIAVDAKESILAVATMVAGLFSEYSNFANLDLLVLNYRNVCLKIDRNTERKNIMAMLMKAVSMLKYQNSDNYVSVETAVQPLPEDVWKFDLVEIPSWCQTEKVLRFGNTETRESVYIALIKDGVITPYFCASDDSIGTIEGMKKLFLPISNMYGIKAIEMKINHFEYRMDKDTDIGHFYHLLCRAMAWI